MEPYSDSGVIPRQGTIQYQPLTGPIVPAAPAPDLSWLPTFPDQHLRGRPNIEARTGFGMNLDPIPLPPPPPAPEMSWSPQYRDRYRAAPPQITHHQTLAFNP